MQNTPTNPSEPFEETINLREELNKYLRYWPWFVLSVIAALVIANIYLRFTPSSYQTTASILVKDESNTNMSQMAIFQDIGLGDRLGGANLENEVEILHSRLLTERVVRQLQLNIRYFYDGRVRSNELFNNTPLRLEVLSDESEWPKEMPDLFVTPISLTEFKIKHEDETSATNRFGEEFEYKDVRYLIHATDKLEPEVTTRISVSSLPRTIDSYRNNIQVTTQGKVSSIISINHVSELPEKSQAIIDELIDQYNRDAIQDKNMVSRNTADFIDERLEIVWGELDSVELRKVRYKESNQLVDLQTEGAIFLENASEFNKKLVEAQTALSQVEAMTSYLRTGSQSSLLPANLGTADSGLMALIQQYNQMVMERNQMLVNSTETHPTVIRLTGQLSDLKANILESLQNLKSSLDIELKDLGRQELRIGGQLASIPLKERDFTTIERQQEIKQTLYLYLLQKREETSIALAVTEPKAKIVDSAYTPIKPIAPKRSIILLAALLIGALIPFGTIYLRNLLDNKVRKRTDILAIIPDASVLGEIPKIKSKHANNLVEKNDLGVLTESFRVLRTNLQFAGIINKDKVGKCLIVTSSIKGEGKTMISVNLAMTLAHAGNKVLLVGGDIRNPQLSRFFSKNQDKNVKGLVEYLVYEDTTLEDYTFDSEISENLTILHSGAIPPNPTELLMSDRVTALIEEGKQKYDYVIIDTAPTLLVTDTLLFSELADSTLFVSRAGFTQKGILEFAKEMKEEQKLKRVNFVLNDVSEANYGYGGKYGYGYGYHAEEKSIWRKIKHAMSF